MFELLQAHAWEVAAVVAAALAATTVLDDALASILRRVPIVGGVLAALARRFSLRFREWLRSKVPESAEKSVAEAEGLLGNRPGTGDLKRASAKAALAEREPGLMESELEREIEAAFRRLVGEARLERHDKPESLKYPPEMTE